MWSLIVAVSAATVLGAVFRSAARGSLLGQMGRPLRVVFVAVAI
jgi:hypothetical protein